MIKFTKYITLLFWGMFVWQTSIAQRQGTKFDTINMVRVIGGTYLRALDTMQLQQASKRFGAPTAFFMPEFPSGRWTVPTFYMDKYEVTNADFKKFIDANPQWSKKNIPDSLHDGNYLKDWNGDRYPKAKGDCPVVYVCYAAIAAYTNWVGKRLPSEAEWEYAAKGVLHPGVTFPWGEGDANANLANYVQSGLAHTVKVGSYPPNNLGLYDMAGNVWEFCGDLWDAVRYQTDADFRKAFKQKDGAKLNEIRLRRVWDRTKAAIRGGSWKSEAVELRTTYRIGYSIKSCSDSVGFRCAANYSGPPTLKH